MNFLHFRSYVHLLVLLSILRCLCAERAVKTAPSRILATVITSDADLLPARVMMQSALKNGQLADDTDRVIFATPGVTHRRARVFAEHDGISYNELNKPLMGQIPLTYTALFEMTQYETILYLSPYIMVQQSLLHLFRCPRFCAAFHNPCSFSTSVMVISPNATDNAAMSASRKKLLDPVSGACRENYRPDRLTVESCLLNDHFGKQLLTAPSFDIDMEERSDAKPIVYDASRGRMRRLPMGCQTAHYFYYPRMRWEVPQRPCGKIRNVDFEAPSFLRPWNWWTFSLLDLSWEWRRYRLELSNPRGFSVAEEDMFYKRLIGLYAVFFGIATLSKYGKNFARFAGRKFDFGKIRAGKLRIGERELVVVGVALGTVFCFASWIVAFACVPPTLPPVHATILFAHYKVAAQSVCLVLLGRRYIAQQSLSSDAKLVRARTATRAMYETVGLACVEVCSVVVLTRLVSWKKAETMYGKVAWLGPAVLVYVFVTLSCLAQVCMVWLSVGVSDGAALSDANSKRSGKGKDFGV